MARLNSGWCLIFSLCFYADIRLSIRRSPIHTCPRIGWQGPMLIDAYPETTLDILMQSLLQRTSSSSCEKAEPSIYVYLFLINFLFQLSSYRLTQNEIFKKGRSFHQVHITLELSIIMMKHKFLANSEKKGIVFYKISFNFSSLALLSVKQLWKRDLNVFKDMLCQANKQNYAFICMNASFWLTDRHIEMSSLSLGVVVTRLSLWYCSKGKSNEHPSCASR